MRLNQRGSLSTRLPSLSWQRRLRLRRSTRVVLFTLTMCAGMILLTREYVLFRLGILPYLAANFFLVAIAWLIAGTLPRKTKAVYVAIFLMQLGSICNSVSRVWRSMDSERTGKLQIQRLKTLAQATQLYAADHSEKLPLASIWMDSLSDRVKEADFNLGTTFLPPLPGYHVAMNSDLSGKSLAELESKNKYCLFFISYKSERNANDALNSITEEQQGVTISGFVRPFSEPVLVNNPSNVPGAINK